MKTYILSVAGVVLWSAVISVILPSGKMGKFIKGAMNLFVLVVLVSPFTDMFLGKNFEIPTVEIAEDTIYLEKCAQMLSEEDRVLVESYLSKEFAVSGNVSVRRSIKANFPREKIIIEITDFGIFGQDERIYTMTRIREAVEKEFGCTAEVFCEENES